jgi:hypothetical protein
LVSGAVGLTIDFRHRHGSARVRRAKFIHNGRPHRNINRPFEKLKTIGAALHNKVVDNAVQIRSVVVIALHIAKEVSDG